MQTIYEALRSNDGNKVKYLLDTNHEASKDPTLCHHIKLENNVEMFRTIFTACRDKINDFYKTRSFLVEAIEEGKDFKIIEAIIDLDKDCVNRIDEQGRTPLIMAVFKNRELFLIKFLLQYNANVNVCDTNGNSPLHYVNNVELVKLLIENGGNVNCVNVYGNTPVMNAMEFNRDREIVLELINNGADVEALNRYGQSSLHLAFMRKYDLGVIDEICRKTDDYNVEDIYLCNPLYYAIVDNDCVMRSPYQDYCIHDLIKKGFAVNCKVFVYAIKVDDESDNDSQEEHETHCRNDKLIELLAKYVDVDSVDEGGNCVLHHAPNTNIINILGRRGAPINHKNNEGITPLMKAIICEYNYKFIESLLYWGSHIKTTDRLFRAFQYNKFIIPDTDSDLLVLHGMSVSLKDNFIKGYLFYILDSIARDGFDAAPPVGLVRHVFLSNENVTIQEFLMMNVEVNSIIGGYHRELNKMKNEIIVDNVSYYDFSMKKYRLIRCPFVDKGLTEDDCLKIVKLFPVFFKEIIVKIKINIKIFERKALLRKLMCTSLAKWKERENNSKENENFNREYAVLDCDSMFLVGSYLIEREIKCLLAAAIS